MEYFSDEDRSPSLKEFETIERSQDMSEETSKQIQICDTETTPNKSQTPISNDDVFMYNSSPNYSLPNRDSLTGKPPMKPNPQSPTINHHSSSPMANHTFELAQPLVNLLNMSNQCLSTITECSNETFETCSNQSSQLRQQIGAKSHSTSYEEDDDQKDEWNLDLKKNIDLSFQNVTIRRKKLPNILENDLTVRESSSLSMSSDKTATTVNESSICNKNIENNDINNNNETHHTLTAEGLNQSAEISPVNITDKLFEKFCLISNDEIMRYSSIFSDIQTDSLEASILPPSTSTGGYEQLYDEASVENKINKKLLNEILDEHIDEPKSDGSFNKKQTKQINEIKSSNPHSIISSSSCSKLSSVNKQTVLANDSKNNEFRSSNSTVEYGSMNNKNVPFEDEEDDEVFLNERNNVGHSLEQKSSPSSESDGINIEKKISSKSLNSIHDRKSFLSHKTSSLPPSACSSDPSFPMLNATSSKSSSNSRFTNKPSKQKQQKTNLSTTTTLEISSYTSDSLYNSNFVITPMGSEAISPALYNNFLKSPLIQQGSPLLSVSATSHKTEAFSSSCPNNLTNVGCSLTPKSRSNLAFGFNNSENSDSGKLNTSAIKSPPPPPPPSLKPKSATKTPVFPSPPSLSTKCTGYTVSQSSPTESFPLPPIFLDKTSTELEASQESLIKSADCTKNGTKMRKTSSSKSLIESLTAKLNLAPCDKSNTSNSGNSSYNAIGSLFKTNRKPAQRYSPSNKPTKPEVKPEISLDQVDSSGQNLQSDKKQSNISTDGVENSSKGNWKAANFSLYGLDTDDDERSSVGKYLNEQTQPTPWQKDQTDAKDDESCSLPLPPPPTGFDDNNNIIIEKNQAREIEKYVKNTYNINFKI